jgi:hypothetical protein
MLEKVRKTGAVRAFVRRPNHIEQVYGGKPRSRIAMSQNPEAVGEYMFLV